jgi:hypothetical protein
MVEATRTAEVPFAWFTAAEEFGQNPALCDYLEREHILYVIVIPKNTTFLGPRRRSIRRSRLRGVPL